MNERDDEIVMTLKAVWLLLDGRDQPAHTQSRVRELIQAALVKTGALTEATTTEILSRDLDVDG